MGEDDDGCRQKQDAAVGRTICNHEPEERIIGAEVQSLNEMKLSSPVESVSPSVPQEKKLESFPRCTDSQSPEPDKKLELPQPEFHVAERKHHLPSSNSKSGRDENEYWSLAASTATSLRTAKITVPVAPRFTCVDRLQRRKEFYSKLEEKHRALEREKLEYEARVKEEEEAALKLMRKNMSYKANPVPSFYHEGPPAKVELKKIPVTRAKSPNLSRRKSCSDAPMKPPPPSEMAARATHRRSTGGTARGTKACPPGSKSKGQNESPCPNASS